MNARSQMAHQIGMLMLENAEMREDLTRLQAENAKLRTELEALKPGAPVDDNAKKPEKGKKANGAGAAP